MEATGGHNLPEDSPGRSAAAAGEEVFAEAEQIERVCLNWVRAHRQASDFWNRVHVLLGVPSVALATAAGATVLAGRFRIVAGILALMAATLSALMTWLDPRTTADLHRAAANAYLALAGRARRLAKIDRFAGRTIDQLRLTLYELADALDEQVRQSPYVARRYVQEFRAHANRHDDPRQ